MIQKNRSRKTKDKRACPLPSQGFGDRCLNCDQYSCCLDLACRKHWLSFNCQQCAYPKRGMLNYRFSEFEDALYDDPEDDLIIYCSETALDFLAERHNRQEAMLIDLIDRTAAEKQTF